MNKKKNSLILVLLNLYLLIHLVVPAYASESKTEFAFTILHTNDLHSHEDSYLDNGRSIGGIARIAHLIKLIKAKNANVLIVDAGDIFQGTPYFEQYHGQTDVECLNKAGYDIFTIGNHEFDEGSENLAKQLALAKFDVISANLDVSAQPALSAIVKPSVVKIINGEKVAFVGAVTPTLMDTALYLHGVKLKAIGKDWITPIKQEVEKLKAQGINKIIIVSHVGVDQDKELASHIEDVDAIIGGHSHTRLETPIIVKHHDGSSCLIVQTGCYARALGKLDLSFDQNGQVDLPKTQYHLINITNRIFEDPSTRDYIKEKGQPFAYLKTTVIGASQGYFSNKLRNYSYDSPLGDLICDALADAGAKYGATIDMQNRGGIRACLEQGPITLEKIREILPFDNKLVVATVDGQLLLQVLEHSVSGQVSGKFLDVSGLKFIYDPLLESGHRVLFAYALNKENMWEEIVPDHLYRITTNSFSFNGGEAYDFHLAKDVVSLDGRLSSYFGEYLRKNKTVAPQTPSRIVAVDSNIAKLTGSGQNATLSVNAPGKILSLSVLSGVDIGVSFIPKMGVVPLKEPKMLRTFKNAPAPFTMPLAELLDKSMIKKKDKLCVVLRVRILDNSTHVLKTKTIISSPLIWNEK